MKPPTHNFNPRMPDIAEAYSVGPSELEAERSVPQRGVKQKVTGKKQVNRDSEAQLQAMRRKKLKLHGQLTALWLAEMASGLQDARGKKC